MAEVKSRLPMLGAFGVRGRSEENERQTNTEERVSLLETAWS
jgi:hypothetical protein